MVLLYGKQRVANCPPGTPGSSVAPRELPVNVFLSRFPVCSESNLAGVV